MFLPATGAWGAGMGCMVGGARLAGGEDCLAGGGGDDLAAGGGITAGAGAAGACSLLGLVSLEVAALLPVSCLKCDSFNHRNKRQGASSPALKAPSSS